METAPGHLQGWLRAALDDEALRRPALAALHVFEVGGRDAADLEDSVERIKAGAARPGGLWDSTSPFCCSNPESMISAVSFRLQTLEASTAALRTPETKAGLPGAPQAAVQSPFSLGGAHGGDKPRQPALTPDERKVERVIKAVLGTSGGKLVGAPVDAAAPPKPPPDSGYSRNKSPHVCPHCLKEFKQKEWGKSMKQFSRKKKPRH